MKYWTATATILMACTFATGCTTTQTTPDEVADNLTAKTRPVRIDSPAAPSMQPGAPLANVVVCRREARTGTRLKTKVCRTPEQVEAERIAAQEFLRHGMNASVQAQFAKRIN